MDLRDRFAAHAASALAPTISDPHELAQRAYDIADAMLAERARRIDEDEERAARPPAAYHGVLLDEPMPDDEEELDLSWLDPPYDPSWDVEPEKGSAPSRPPGPGLARTQPDAEEDRKERSA